MKDMDKESVKTEYDREREMFSLREKMQKESKEEVESILTLADLKPERMWELANGYWPLAPIYDDARIPWWLAQTSIGLIRMGWRKRVIAIDWEATGIKWEVTADNVTKGPTMVHAYSTQKGVEYLKELHKISGIWQKS
jgi:hypothetical protein